HTASHPRFPDPPRGGGRGRGGRASARLHAGPEATVSGRNPPVPAKGVSRSPAPVLGPRRQLPDPSEPDGPVHRLPGGPPGAACLAPRKDLGAPPLLRTAEAD